jgi:hypothetical protein
VPAPIRARRLAKRNDAQRGQLAIGLAAAYLVFVLAGLGAFAHLKWREHALETGLKANAGTVDRLSETAARWQAVRPAVDPAMYPMECLRACVQVLPAEVRLTQFQHAPQKVLVMGEGKDAASIVRFFNAVKADPFLKQWTWAMPQPQVMANNHAQFQLEGTHAETASN